MLLASVIVVGPNGLKEGLLHETVYANDLVLIIEGMAELKKSCKVHLEIKV